MRHKLCRSFHPWCPGVKNRCLLALCGGIRRSAVDSSHTNGEWPGALMYSLIFVCTTAHESNRDAGDLRRHHGHYYDAVMNSPYSEPHKLERWCPVNIAWCSSAKPWFSAKTLLSQCGDGLVSEYIWRRGHYLSIMVNPQNVTRFRKIFLQSFQQRRIQNHWYINIQRNFEKICATTWSILNCRWPIITRTLWTQLWPSPIYVLDQHL